MPDSTTLQVLTILLLLLVIVANAVARRTTRAQRPISAMEALPQLVSRSIETNRPLHMAMGGFDLGDQETLLALAAADAFYESARRLSLSDAPPIVTIGSSTTLQIARDMLRRAHLRSPLGSQPRPYNVRWYPDTGFTMVSAFSVMDYDDQLAGQVLAGRGGPELALPLWGAELRQTPTIVAATRPSGQAVGYALADHVLIGEELFAVPGYMDEQSPLRQRTLVIDIVRLMLVLLLIAAFSVNVLRQASL
jgi:hypothetical protein